MGTDFFNHTGKMALGSRLRMLTAKITEDAAKIYQLYDIPLQPKWFPVFWVLSENKEKTVTDIANEIGHSQPSVSNIVREMTRKGLAVEQKDAADKRRNVVRLSDAGRELTGKIRHQYTDVNNTIESILSQTENNLWKAIEEWEFHLDQKSLLHRVQEERKKRERKNIRIVDYTPAYENAFRELNKQWISTYFKMEDADYKALDHPDRYILSKGGHIMVALYNGEPAGVCALVKMYDPQYDFELAKMAVAPKTQGLSIGLLLGQAVIKRAKKLGASALYLESNTILKPAINLYHKLGFTKVTGRETPYERCNIQMELVLKRT